MILCITTIDRMAIPLSRSKVCIRFISFALQFTLLKRTVHEFSPMDSALNDTVSLIPFHHHPDEDTPANDDQDYGPDQIKIDRR